MGDRRYFFVEICLPINFLQLRHTNLLEFPLFCNSRKFLSNRWHVHESYGRDWKKFMEYGNEVSFKLQDQLDVRTQAKCRKVLSCVVRLYRVETPRTDFEFKMTECHEKAKISFLEIQSLQSSEILLEIEVKA